MPARSTTTPPRPCASSCPIRPAASPTRSRARGRPSSCSSAVPQAVVVENRSGAAGNIGFDYVLRQPADGYTLLLAPASNLTVQPAPVQATELRPRARLHAGVAAGADAAGAAGRIRRCPPPRPQELIDYSKKNPGKVNYGASVGAYSHLAGELLRSRTGADFTRHPTRRTRRAINDLLSGQTRFIFNEVMTAIPFIKAGQLRPLAVAYQDARALAAQPAHHGRSGPAPTSEVASWYGGGRARHASAAGAAACRRRCARSCSRPPPKRYDDLGAFTVGSTPEEFGGASSRAETVGWVAVVKQAGIQAELIPPPMPLPRPYVRRAARPAAFGRHRGARPARRARDPLVRAASSEPRAQRAVRQSRTARSARWCRAAPRPSCSTDDRNAPERRRQRGGRGARARLGYYRRCACSMAASTPGPPRACRGDRRLRHPGQGLRRPRAAALRHARPRHRGPARAGAAMASPTTLVDARPRAEFEFLSLPGARNHAGTELALRRFEPGGEDHLWAVNCFSRTRGIVGATTLRLLGRAPDAVLRRGRRDGLGPARRARGAERRAEAELLPPESPARLRRIADGLLARFPTSRWPTPPSWPAGAPTTRRTPLPVRRAPAPPDPAFAGTAVQQVPGGQLLMHFENLVARAARASCWSTIRRIGCARPSASFWLTQLGQVEVHVFDGALLSWACPPATSYVDAAAGAPTPIDARCRAGRRRRWSPTSAPGLEYERGHLPGALYLLPASLARAVRPDRAGRALVFTSLDGTRPSRVARDAQPALASGPGALGRLAGGTQGLEGLGTAAVDHARCASLLTPFDDDWGSRDARPRPAARPGLGRLPRSGAALSGRWSRTRRSASASSVLTRRRGAGSGSSILMSSTPRLSWVSRWTLMSLGLIDTYFEITATSSRWSSGR